MNGYDAYNIYLAMRLHFSSDYDFFRYNGKSRSSENTFNKRKDKYSFHKLAREYNDQKLINLLAVLFCHKDSVYVGDMFGPSAETMLREDVEWKLSWKSNFLNDLEKVIDFAAAIKSVDGGYPDLLTLAFQKDISYNTLAILETNLGTLTAWNNKLSDDFIWESYYKKLKKYAPFVFYGVNVVDESASRLVLLEYLKTITLNKSTL
jgi:hypothetical protein